MTAFMTLSPEFLVQAALVLAAGGAYVYLVRRWPRWGVAACFLVIAFIPIWVGLTSYLSAASAVAALTAVALATRRLPLWGFGDLLFAVLVVCALAPYAIGELRLTSVFGVVLIWCAGYAFGRLAVFQVGASWVYTCVAVVFSVVGVLAVVEVAFSWHALASWGPNTALRAFWGEIITRGSLDRSEGAFGHSIALGAALAIAVCMAVESRVKPVWRLVMIAAMLAGAAASLSRTGVICTAFGLVLAVVFLRSETAGQVRRGLIAVGLTAAVVIVPFQMSALAQDQGAEGSAAYRSDLVTLIGYIESLGTSPAIQSSASGTVFFGQFQSIDNQLLILGLNHGWFTVLAFLAILTYVGLSLISGRATAAEVAVLSQLPALVTVALITQYAIFFWIALGIAIGARAERRSTTMSQDRRSGRRSLSTEGTVR